MKIQKSSFFAAIYAITAFFVSMYLLPFYRFGDQWHYREFYSSCFDSGFLSLPWEFFCYSNTLGSKEPLYFIISKIAHTFLSKDLYISIVNTIFVYLIVKLIFQFYRKFWDRQIFIALILSNYYFVVLALAAERLKFGFLFFTLALLMANSKRVFFIAASILSHVQMSLMIAPLYISKILQDNTKLWKKIVVSIACLVGFFGVFFLLKDHIMSKLEVYSNGAEQAGTGIIGVVKTSIFIILGVISTRKFVIFIAGMPLIALSYFLGADRIGMLAFILYVGAVIFYKRRADLILLIVLLYFSFKSIGFILNILNYGTGYVG